MTTTAQDFLRPPFSCCPECGHDAFGLLAVYARRYLKRCRACRFTKDYPLPEVQKRVIYLDQLALSNMMFALNPQTVQFQAGRVDPFWRTLFEKLDALIKLQLLICPGSQAHCEESLPHGHFEALQRLTEHLSQGVSFRDFATIERFQVVLHARNWLAGRPNEAPAILRDDILHGEVNAWTDTVLVTVHSTVTEEQIAALQASRDQALGLTQRLFEYWQAETILKFGDWLEWECGAFGKAILAKYEEFRGRLVLIEVGLVVPEPADLLPPPQFVLVNAIHDAFVEEGVSPETAWARVREYFLSPSLKVIPRLRISALLWAAMARKAAAGMKRPPTRGVVQDTRTIASLLPYCDALFLDNEMRAYLGEQPLAEELKGGARIFSSSNRGEFLAYLDAIAQSATREHLKLVETVYGPGWAQPFISLFSPDVT